MIRGSRSSCHRFFLAVFAVAFCVVASVSATAQTRTNFASNITSESMTAVWVARERGLFKKHGLDMQYIVMPRSPLAIAALVAGEIDVAIVGPGHLISAGTGGADLIGIANFFLKLDCRLNVRPDIKKSEDLRGKRIAISGPGATSHLVTLLALQALNVDPVQARIALLTIPGTELNRRLALESGSVDGTTLRGSVGDMYGNKGFTVLYNFKNTRMTLPQSMLVTSRRTAAAKPQVVEAYVKTLIEGIGLLLDPNKASVTKTITTNLRLSNAADAGEAYHSVVNSYERVPYTSVESMKRLHVLLSTINPKVKEVRVESVIDNSFVSKLDQSGFVQSVWKK
jgi:ABC-type nitrate/sulfonate/bicarbonate transport system substrate-binding protein